VIAVTEDVFLALRELLLLAGVPARDGAHIADDARVDLDMGLATRLGADGDEFLTALGTSRH
jgi:hypothetical protein